MLDGGPRAGNEGLTGGTVLSRLRELDSHAEAALAGAHAAVEAGVGRIGRGFEDAGTALEGMLGQVQLALGQRVEDAEDLGRAIMKI